MSLCVDCLLREKPEWLTRYQRGSLLLALFGLGVFSLPDTLVATALQALFFVIMFPWTIWPLVAAQRPQQEKSHGQR